MPHWHVVRIVAQNCGVCSMTVKSRNIIALAASFEGLVIGIATSNIS